MHFHGMVHVIPRIGVHLWLISVLGGGKVAICQCRFIQYHAKSLRDCIFGFQANLCGNLHSNQTTP